MKQLQVKITDEAKQIIEDETLGNLNWYSEFVSRAIVALKKSGYNFIQDKSYEKQIRTENGSKES